MSRAADARGGRGSRPRALWRLAWLRLSQTRLTTKLVLYTAVLTAVVVCSVFLALSLEVSANTERLFAEEMSRNQRTLLNLQNRSLRQLLWTSSLITESPTLRAAMETYRLESTMSRNPRRALLATVQSEIDKIVAGLDKDLLVVTDDRGLVLAASERRQARPAVGENLSNLVAVSRSLDPDEPIDASNFAVVQFQEEYFQVGCVPIVLRGFTIGTLMLGERLDRTFVQDLRETFDGEIVVATPTQLILSTLPQAREASARFQALTLETGSGAGQPRTIRLGEGDFVAAPLRLGLDRIGAPVVLYLLHSPTAALQQLDQALLLKFVLYGSLAIALGGLGAGLVTRAALRPFDSFVGFMRSVAESGNYSSRFHADGMTREIQTLNDSYDHLIDSLAQQHTELEARTRELSQANEGLVGEIRERERAEQALRSSEQQLRQSQKLEAIGTLAGGVAHDFNNLLTVMSSYAELVLHELGPDNPHRGDLEQIRQAAKRAAGLINQLLAFSRKQVLQPKVIDLNAVVGGIETMLRRLIGEHIDLHTVKGTGLARIKADPGQIEQVIMNLAVNARDAMHRGGRLIIETANVELDERFANRHASVRPGAYVMLSVTDTGEGMDEATRARIFEPFFTTKGPGKGTGLGLSTVYGIIKQSGGSIWVYSEAGRGTTFRIYLPQVDEIGEPLERGGLQGSSPAGSETILLAEDEDPVRKLAQRILEGSGYRVLSASHGGEAMALAQAHAGPIHLLLTDVVMPQMSGRELVEQLAPLRPEMRVLYVSGYTDDAIIHHGVRAPGTQFLQKPFTPEGLTRKVRSVLDGSDEPVDAATGALKPSKPARAIRR